MGAPEAVVGPVAVAQVRIGHLAPAQPPQHRHVVFQVPCMPACNQENNALWGITA